MYAPRGFVGGVIRSFWGLCLSLLLVSAMLVVLTSSASVARNRCRYAWRRHRR